MTAKIELKDASFSYDDKHSILTDLSFQINSGDNVCLLGPNGSGKSTLLRCMCGLNPMPKNKIFLDGKDVNDYNQKDLARKICFLAQSHMPTFAYSVFDVVLMGRAPHMGLFDTPSSYDQEIAYKAMETLGILPLQNQPYSQLSSGQMQLVLIARALTQESEVLFLDEPTSHLDLANECIILQFIKKLSKKGITILMTSHFPSHAFSSSGTVGLLNNGQLIAWGPAEEVLNEANLKRTYGIDVRIISVGDGSKQKVCYPVMDEP